MLRAWIPAFAGMTVKWFTAAAVPGCYGLDPGFRRDNGDVVHRCRRARMLRAWVPAFAGMTVSA